MKLLAALSLALSLFAGRAAAEAPLVVVTAERMPMAYRQDGRLTGLMVDLVRETFRRTGRDVEIQLLPWPRCIAELKEGKADAILTIFKTPEREAQFAFTQEEVLHQTESLFMKKGKAFFFDGDLGYFSGKKVGVVYQTSYGSRLDQALAGSLFGEIVTQRTMADLVKMLAHGRIDVLPGDRGRILGAAEETGLSREIVELRPVVEAVPGYMAFTRARDMSRVSHAVDQALRAMKKDGTYAAILEKYPDY